jgi:hypothetical protein
VHDLTEHNAPGTVLFQAPGPHIFDPVSSPYIQGPLEQLPATFVELLQLSVRHLITKRREMRPHQVVHVQVVQVYENTVADLLAELARGEEEVDVSSNCNSDDDSFEQSDENLQRRPSSADSAIGRIGAAFGCQKWTTVSTTIKRLFRLLKTH